MVLALAFLTLVAGPSRAGDGVAAATPGAAAPRLMVRLDASAHPLTGDVVAHLTPDGGAVVDCALEDNGERPDMAAGDGVWTGFAEVAGDHARVSVSAAGWSGDAGDVALSAADITRRASGERLRQLGLTVVDGKLVAAADMAAGAPSPVGAAMERTRGGGGGSKDEALSDEGSEGRGRRHAKTAAEPASNTLWYVAAAIASLSLLGVGALWFRGARRAARLPDGVRRLSDLGLFGPGTPALVPGVSQWIVAEADEAALVRHLLLAVAGQRPVLVHAADALELPATPKPPSFKTRPTICRRSTPRWRSCWWSLRRALRPRARWTSGRRTSGRICRSSLWSGSLRRGSALRCDARSPTGRGTTARPRSQGLVVRVSIRQVRGSRRAAANPRSARTPRSTSAARRRCTAPARTRGASAETSDSDGACRITSLHDSAPS